MPPGHLEPALRRPGSRAGARAGYDPWSRTATGSGFDRVREGGAAGFWRLVQEGADDLKWCGASPLYTFLRTVDGVRGDLLGDEQWNIDDQSVVTFAGLAFRKEKEGAE